MITKVRFTHLFTTLAGLAILSVFFPVQVSAQSTANTSYWIANSGTNDWNTVANWQFDGAAATSLPQAEPSGEQNVLFSNSGGTVPTAKLTFNVDIPSGNFEVGQGGFDFDLNGKLLEIYDLVLEGGSANFIDSSASGATIELQGLVLDGTGATYQYSNLLMNLGGGVAGNVGVDIVAGNGLNIGGANNTVTVEAGQSVNPGALTGVTFQVSGTAAASNNLLEVNGGAIVQSSYNSINVNGFYNANDPNNIIQANNSVFVHNGGQVYPNSVSIGAGSNLRVETGGQVILLESVSVAQYGSFLLDGTGSVVSGTGQNTVNGNYTGAFSVSGSATICNGATLSGFENGVTVGSTGYLSADNVTLNGLDQPNTLTASGTAVLNNVPYAMNGGTVIYNGLLQVEGGSSITGSNGAYFYGSGTVAITGSSTVTIPEWEPSGTVSVDPTSTFSFNELEVSGGYNLNNTTVSIAGTGIWGTGNIPAPGTSGEDTYVNLSVSAGTTLLLGGGFYDLDGNGKGSNSQGYAVGDGSLTVQAGATLGGSGYIGGDPNLVGGGTTLNVEGGTLEPGTATAGGVIAADSGLNFTNGPSTVAINVFDYADYGQVQAGSIGGDGSPVVVMVSLAPFLTSTGLAEGYLEAGDSIQIFADPNGDPMAVGNGYTFNFGDSLSQLAAYGLTWDTTQFATTGALNVASLSPPIVTTGTAGNVFATSALVSGTVNPEGSVYDVRFDYGPDTNYGESVTAMPATVSGTPGAVAVSGSATGLTPNMTYHYRAVAYIGAEEYDGADQTFTTAAAYTPVQAWRYQWFGTPANSGSGADDATPAGDGIPNLLKFATGTGNPDIPGTMPCQIAHDGTNLNFTYSVNLSATDVNYAVAWSDTLPAISWSTAGAAVTGTVNEGNNTELVTVSVPRGSDPQRFVELQVSLISCTNTYVTTPAGISTVQIPGNGATSIIGINLAPAPVYTGWGEVFNAKGTDISTDASVDVTQLLTQGNYYAAQVVAGDSRDVGSNSLISSWTDTEPTSGPGYIGYTNEAIFTTGAISDYGSGDTFQVAQLPTISQIFGTGASLLLTGGPAATADLVNVRNAINGGLLTLYYSTGGINGTGWRAIGMGTTDYGSQPVYFTDALGVQKKSAGSASLDEIGFVQTGPVTLPVETGYNYYSNVYAAGVTLAGSGLYQPNAPSNSLLGGPAATADQLLFDPTGAGILVPFYYSTGGINGTGWREIGAGATPQDNVALPSGFSILRGGGAVEIQQQPPY